MNAWQEYPFAALHASAPEGHKCADCFMDKEPCPTCYEVWWKKRHQNVMIEAARPEEKTSAQHLMFRIQAALDGSEHQQLLVSRDLLTALHEWLRSPQKE